jgi:hypothetical protein
VPHRREEKEFVYFWDRNSAVYKPGLLGDDDQIVQGTVELWIRGKTEATQLLLPTASQITSEANELAIDEATAYM